MGFSGERYKPPPGFDYWVEVMSDDRRHCVLVSAHERFQPALDAYTRIVRGKEGHTCNLRVGMRHKAHIYKDFTPERLKEPGKIYERE